MRQPPTARISLSYATSRPRKTSHPQVGPRARRPLLRHLMARRVHQHPNRHSRQIYPQSMGKMAVDPVGEPCFWLLRDLVNALCWDACLPI
ncbi:hypothetical protein C8Q72DRAFT_374557 [Fomitopsis betulina]|nr:hypothetical protein C8Q72DRAFT_374557 [Fomitopsis betulina]